MQLITVKIINIINLISFIKTRVLHTLVIDHNVLNGNLYLWLTLSCGEGSHELVLASKTLTFYSIDISNEIVI